IYACQTINILVWRMFSRNQNPPRQLNAFQLNSLILVAMNILLRPFETAHQTAPFSKIHKEDYLPAFQEAIEQTKTEVRAICEDEAPASFPNTIEGLAYSGLMLDQISNIFFNLHSAETDDDMDRIAQQVAPKLAALSNDIILNEQLFERIKHVYQQKEDLRLNTEQKTLLEKYYRDFVRGGALLDEEKKDVLRKIDNELSGLKLQSGEHVSADIQADQLNLTHAEDLEGLPEGTVEAARELAKQTNQE